MEEGRAHMSRSSHQRAWLWMVYPLPDAMQYSVRYLRNYRLVDGVRVELWALWGTYSGDSFSMRRSSIGGDGSPYYWDKGLAAQRGNLPSPDHSGKHCEVRRSSVAKERERRDRREAEEGGGCCGCCGCWCFSLVYEMKPLDLTEERWETNKKRARTIWGSLCHRLR